jgi:hypothetical protein
MHFSEVMEKLRLEVLKREWVSRAYYHIEEEFVLCVVRNSDDQTFKIEFEPSDLKRSFDSLHKDLQENLNLLQPE